MSSTFYVEILTPERKFFWGDVEAIIVKTPTGEMGILKGHIPMVVFIDTGIIKIKKDDKWIEAVLSEGFMEVKRDRTVLLVDTAEWPDEIDVNRAQAAKRRAEERLLRRMNRTEYIQTKAALARAMARLKVKGIK
ncbi:MAG TPA: ATP synthase F1 subunit epsilon [Acetivibrio sp.]|jgi:F-type H+-transporting ATPase subunit epsilon|nr:ATP synthase F1 subunit epsilon [Clostridium sp.]HOQ37170.1 ATP synthase F1 subunit epsilon [Acetivibrio sp.]HPT91603.1 ATP synthase F1 subunit epsilon [Acetivibrio sp.]HQA56606.1 ATP synthase F1 subunit epsilon [Acetivibrio sp.]